MRTLFNNRAIEAVLYLIAMFIGVFMALGAVFILLTLGSAAGQLLNN